MSVGRKPLPTVEKELRGNPGKRALNKNEPKPQLLWELPEPPDYIGEYGEKEWRRVGPVLIKQGLLSEADVMIFEAYCMNVNMMIVAKLDIKENGITIIGARGRTRNPALATFASATTALRSLASEFGMTPSSRSRIKLPGDDGESLADLLADDSPDDFNAGV